MSAIVSKKNVAYFNAFAKCGNLLRVSLYRLKHWVNRIHDGIPLAIIEIILKAFVRSLGLIGEHGVEVELSRGGRG
jgi:hypothetical protein